MLDKGRKTYQDGRIHDFDPRLRMEERERILREEKIQDLLPDEEADTLGRAYDGRLVRRLLQYLAPYRNKLLASIFFMVIASLLSVS
ncbi:MAG: hypothetical protein L0322_13840, partial [Chloroflexi bacterium]|nr:hypothetical protein [Chloroflexota bacterium]